MRTPVPGEFGFPLGVVVAVAAAFGAVAVGATGQPVVSVVAMVAVVDLVAVVSTARATLGTAVVCWCLHSGFVLGRAGELVFTGRAGHDALVIGLCAAVGALFASLARSAVADVAVEIPRPRQPRALGGGTPYPMVGPGAQPW
ncbi:hypothetical protein [Actinokineospora inagensis]|uniref:hypothetical protein n=1 Tax=Actinokineospora inagensis TaxID=103730 RepID=UPI0004196310|nr:hypothetical protein [Actinokineospora inagensis]